jgi:type IV pilus assembly protein PilB
MLQKLPEISDFIQKLLKEGETTIEAIQKLIKKKYKTFDYEVDESAELLDENLKKILKH